MPIVLMQSPPHVASPAPQIAVRCSRSHICVMILVLRVLDRLGHPVAARVVDEHDLPGLEVGPLLPLVIDLDVEPQPIARHDREARLVEQRVAVVVDDRRALGRRPPARSGSSRSMSPRTIVIFSELRSVSVGCASGLGWTATPVNVRVHPVAAASHHQRPTTPKPLMISAWRTASRPSIATSARSRDVAAMVSRDRRACARVRRRPIACSPATSCASCAERVRNVGPIYAPVPAGQVDRAQHGVGAVEIVVDDQVLVLVEVPELLDRLAAAGAR